MSADELADLRRRERFFLYLRILKGFVLLPLTALRWGSNLAHLLADLDRLHGAPRSRMRCGSRCVVDRETWLVNGSNIELGDHVKVSAFSALIAGVEATISIGSYSILGPGVFVVAANHGIESAEVPIRYQTWKEKPVVIGDDVWVGANAVILPGTTIGSGAVIGAGTTVSGDIPPRAIVYQDRGPLIMRQRP